MAYGQDDGRGPTWGGPTWGGPHGEPRTGPYPGPGFGPVRGGQAPPPRKKHTARNVFLGFAGFVVLVAVIGTLASGGSPASSSAPRVAATSGTGNSGAPASAAAAAPVAAKPVATYRGSGIENTPRFTVSSTWKLEYSFDCSDFGQAGNFQVFEDGGSDFNGVEVNDLAMSKSASTWAYGDGGQHYLEINSECSWTVKVIDEG